MPNSFVVNKDGTFADLPAPSAATTQEPATAAATPVAVVEVENTEHTESSAVTPEDGDVVVENADATSAAATETAASVEPDELGAAEANTKPQVGRAAKRIEGLVAENKTLKGYSEYLQSVIAKGLQPAAAATTAVQQPTAAATVPTVEEAPTLESCEFDTAKWTRAMNVWTQKQIQTGVQAALQGDRQQQTAAQARAAYEAKCVAFAAKTPDFAVVTANPELPTLHRDAAGLLVASDLAAEITYHLAKHPDQAVRIARQNPAQQAAAIGRLEAELKGSTKTPQKTSQTNNVTRAPAPLTPIQSGGSPGKDPMAMSMKEFVAHDRAQQAARRGTGRR